MRALKKLKNYENFGKFCKNLCKILRAHVKFGELADRTEIYWILLHREIAIFH